jgi:hypothetical protein
MANETTYAEASRVLEAIKVLEELERNGTISDAEQKALNRARASRASNIRNCRYIWRVSFWCDYEPI